MRLTYTFCVAISEYNYLKTYRNEIYNHQLYIDYNYFYILHYTNFYLFFVNIIDLDAKMPTIN